MTSINLTKTDELPTPAQVLTRAAEYIEEHGWTQGEYVDNYTGAVCALGALRKVRDELVADKDYKQYDKITPIVHNAEKAVVDTINTYSLPKWNDNPKRTAEQVVSTFRAVAAKLERKARKPHWWSRTK